jgi:hypothetical protein
VPPTLSSRALNRALLARQHLIERARMPAAAMIEHLVGMQAQVPANPYVALWSRLRDFAPDGLEALIADRQAVRMPLMRTTIHLVTARDALALYPVFGPVLARVFQSGSPFGRRLAGLDLEAVLAAGRELIEDGPLSASELAAALGHRWPDRDAMSLAMAVRYLLPVVQPPPRGLWTRSGRPTWTTLEHWLGEPLDDAPEIDRVVLRYLAAFGPASVADVRTWSGLTGLRDVVERLRPRLATFTDGAGRELFDLPDAPRPDADTAVLPRFMPEYDNLMLSHADRSRVIPESAHGRITGYVGTFLVDGFVSGQWRGAPERGSATLILDPFVSLAGRQRDEVMAEGERLLAFVAPTTNDRGIELGTAWPRPRRGD